MTSNIPIQKVNISNNIQHSKALQVLQDSRQFNTSDKSFKAKLKEKFTIQQNFHFDLPPENKGEVDQGVLNSAIDQNQSISILIVDD